MKQENKELNVVLIMDGKIDKDMEIISGGMQTNPKWDDYLDFYKQEYRPYIIQIRKYIEDNSLIGTTGEEQNNWSFKFNDGRHLGFTWRAWGDLMQAIVNKNEGYMEYYMK
jgi:hypothetical protein